MILNLKEYGIDTDIGGRFSILDFGTAKDASIVNWRGWRFSCRHLTWDQSVTMVITRWRTLLGSAVDFQIKVHLGTKPERNRIDRCQCCRIPMRPITDGLERRLCGAGKAHNLRILQLRVVAN